MDMGDRFFLRTRLFDLRRAAASDRRESEVQQQLQDLKAALSSGETVELTWPKEADASLSTAYLGAPLAQVVLESLSGTPGQLVIHTRAGTARDFLLLAASSKATFVVHLNSEEAAMRWERDDAAPSRRLAMLTQLQEAGWQAWACVGPMRLFSGWREEYQDLIQSAADAGVQRLLVSFPGEDAIESQCGGDVTGLDVLPGSDGYRFGISESHRQEAMEFLTSCLEKGVKKRQMRSSRTAKISFGGSRHERVHFGVRAGALRNV